MSELTLFLALAALAVAALALRRAGRAAHLLEFTLAEQVPELHGQVASRDSDTFRQLEALVGLYVELQPRRPLPPTRGWAASPDFLALLARHALLSRPRVIVECGSGVSTVVLARACERNQCGHVWSLEHLPEMASFTREWLAEHGVGAYATVVDAPLLPHTIDGLDGRWYSAAGLPNQPIDMLVVDGPPAATGRLARYPAGPCLFPRLALRGAVFVDDAHRGDERAMIARWEVEFPAMSRTSAPCEKGAVVLKRDAESEVRS